MSIKMREQTPGTGEKNGVLRVLKILIGCILITLLALAAAVGGSGYLFMRSKQDSVGFLEKTRVNGRSVAGKTPAEVTDSLVKTFLNGEVVLMEDGKEVLSLPIADLGYQPDRKTIETSLTRDMEKEKSDFRSVVTEMMYGNSFTQNIPYTVDETVFKNAVGKNALSEPRKENKNAKILYYEEEEKCRIVPEVQGTKFHDRDLRTWMRGEIDALLTGEEQAEEKEDKQDKADNKNKEDNKSKEDKRGKEGKEGKEDEGDSKDKTVEPAAVPALIEALPHDKKEDKKGGKKSEKKNTDKSAPYRITLTIPASIYIPPDKTVENADFKTKCRVLNQLAGESVTYLFGGESETIDFKTIMNWIRVKDGEAVVREDEVRAYVEDLAQRYSTRYRDRVFYTTWGGAVTFTPGMNEYGYTILENAEFEQLKADILSGQKVQREPVYMYYNDWGCPLFLSRNGMDDLNGTYVEVSIYSQHMWYYRNWQLIVESDVVTGDVTKNLGTASGVFPLAFKESPSILRGGTGKDKYETEVKYWMPFYEGQGLHDAWWKTVFGGDEYKGDGSHGCVNLPPDVAETLYNNIVPGTAIVIY